MSEAMDKVRGVTELPLFPLPLVLFPGAPLPLHIFEPRYRKMLEDVRTNNSLFGLSYFDSSASELACPPVGNVGCVAEVTEVQILPDGRSNIFTVGLIRYRIEGYLERGDPYLVARVSFFEDEHEEAGALEQQARQVSDVFMRIARAIRTINDERANLPDITDTNPQKLSFLVAAAMETELEAKQALLELRSTSERLRWLSQMLNRAVKHYESRARIHEIAKGNGHSGRRVDIE
jgi:Lon protease-like protein